LKEAVVLYHITNGRIIQKYQIEKEENPKYWLHPADTVKLMTTLTKQLMTEKTVKAAFRYTQTAAKVNAE